MTARAAAGAQAGFTLIEVLIALTIAAITIGVGVALYQSVGRATQGGRVAERDWVTEQFLRRQAAEADRDLQTRLSLGRESSTEFGFVTRRSAQWGERGPPVLAVWRYDAITGALDYREAALPPWWPEDRNVQLVEYGELATIAERGVWQGRIFSDVARLKFTYWDERRKIWQSEDTDPSALAPVVRLEIAHAGTERTYAFETRGASSFSSSSGLSPAAQ